VSFQSEQERFAFNQAARCAEIEPCYAGIALEMESDTALHLRTQRDHFEARRGTGSFACLSFLVFLVLLWGAKPMSFKQVTAADHDFNDAIAAGDKCRKSGDLDGAHNWYSDASYLSDDDDGWKAVVMDRWQKLDKARKDAKCQPATTVNAS
jgi:hypothetical protein